MESSNPERNKITSLAKVEINPQSSPSISSSLSDSSLCKRVPNDTDDNTPTPGSTRTSSEFCSPTLAFSRSVSLDHELPTLSTSLATQAPSSQEMDRSTYKLPPSVFERSKINSPTDWSMASNESLFSIKGGNLSFTNDMFKSGELFSIAETSTADLMFGYSFPDQLSSANAAVTRNQEIGLAEATMKEVIKESQAGDDCRMPLTMLMPVGCTYDHSPERNTSNTSYRFAGMAGDVDKAAASLSSSVKSRQGPMQRESRQLRKPEAESEAVVEEAKSTPENAPKFKWFPRFFPCCSLCYN